MAGYARLHAVARLHTSKLRVGELPIRQVDLLGKMLLGKLRVGGLPIRQVDFRRVIFSRTVAVTAEVLTPSQVLIPDVPKSCFL